MPAIPVRRSPAVLAVAALLSLVTACGGSAGADSGGDSDSSGGGDGGRLSSVTLSVGATGWKREEAALKVAGLDDTPYKVKWSVFQGGDLQLQAMRGGALDLAYSSEIPPVFSAADGKPNFKVAAVVRGTTLQQEVIVPKGSDVTGIAGLKGKKVGYVKNTTAHYFLYEMLKRAGLEWSDIDASPLSPNDGLAALNGGSIDAFASYGTSVITARQQGAKTIASAEDILSGNFLWSVSDATLGDAREREAVADLLARIDDAYAYLRDGHEEEFARVIADTTKQPLDQALEQFEDGEEQRPTEVFVTSDEAIASEQKVADAFEELGALPEPLDVSAFWTDALDADLAKALKS